MKDSKIYLIRLCKILMILPSLVGSKLEVNFL